MASLTEFFGFSEFYYTSADCLGIAGRWNLDLFQKESAAYCATNWEQLKINLAQGKYKADENRLRQQCFKSAWVPVSYSLDVRLPEPLTDGAASRLQLSKTWQKADHIAEYRWHRGPMGVRGTYLQIPFFAVEVS